MRENENKKKYKKEMRAERTNYSIVHQAKWRRRRRRIGGEPTLWR